MSKPCSFCVREQIEPPCDGSRAIGSYADIDYEIGDSRAKVFNGYICDFHIDNVEWIRLRVNGKHIIANGRYVKNA